MGSLLFIQSVSSTQAVAECILDKNSVPTNIKTENLLDLYLRKLMVEQNKHIHLKSRQIIVQPSAKNCFGLQTTVSKKNL